MPPEQRRLRRPGDEEKVGDGPFEEQEKIEQKESPELEPTNKEKPRPRRVKTVSFTESSSDGGDSEIVCTRKFVGDDMDRYLDRIGFTERSVPQDGGRSFYRAICEELFLMQTKDVVDEVQQLIEVTVDFENKAKHAGEKGPLPTPDMAAKIRAAAKIFEAIIQVYRKPYEDPHFYNPPEDITPTREISLVEIKPGHFGRILQKHTAEVSGHAQAILYRSMYENVFEVKQSVITDWIINTRKEADHVASGRYGSATDVFHPPVPYSVLKAMDPCIYRNLPFDEFTRNKKTKEPVAKKKEFPVGAVCVFYEDGMETIGTVVAIYNAKNRVVRIGEGPQLKVVNIDYMAVVESPDSDCVAGTAATTTLFLMNDRQPIVNAPETQSMGNAAMNGFPLNTFQVVFTNTYYQQPASYPISGYGFPYWMPQSMGCPSNYFPASGSALFYNPPMMQPTGGFTHQYMMSGNQFIYSPSGTPAIGASPHHGYGSYPTSGTSAPAPLMSIQLMPMNGGYPTTSPRVPVHNTLRIGCSNHLINPLIP